MCPEELHNSVSSAIAIQSDISTAIESLVTILKEHKWSITENNPWWKDLLAKSNKNKTIIQVNVMYI